LSVAEPTFHIARFLPSVRVSTAPLIFIWHVRPQNPPCCTRSLREVHI
jgi:hypothetical protein